MRFLTTGAALAAARALGWSHPVSGNTHDAADIGIPMASPEARISVVKPFEPSSGQHRNLAWALNYLPPLEADFSRDVQEMIKVHYEVAKDQTVVAKLLHHDCDPARPITGLEYTYRAIVNSKDDDLDYYTAAYNINKTSLDDSSIWTPPDYSVNATKAKIEFCHVLQLTAPWPVVEGQPERDDLVIMEHKKPFTLEIDFLGNFTLALPYGRPLPRLRMTIFANVVLTISMHHVNNDRQNLESYYTVATADILRRGLTDARELLGVEVLSIGGNSTGPTTWRTQFDVQEICYNDTDACDNLRTNWTMLADVSAHMIDSYEDGTWTRRLQEEVAERTGQYLAPLSRQRELSEVAVPETAVALAQDAPGMLRGAATTPREDSFWEAVAGVPYDGRARRRLTYVQIVPSEVSVAGVAFPSSLGPPAYVGDNGSRDYECRFDPHCPAYACIYDPRVPDCYNPKAPGPPAIPDDRDNPNSEYYEPGWEYPWYPDVRNDPNHTLYECRYDNQCDEYDPAWDPYNPDSNYHPFPHGDPNGVPEDGYDPRMDNTTDDYDPTLDPNSDDFNPPWLNPTNTSHEDYDPRYDNTTDYYECYLDPSCDEYDPTRDPSNPDYIPQRDPRHPSHDCRHDPRCDDYQCRFDEYCDDYDEDDDPYNNDPYNPDSSWHPQPHGDPHGDPDSYDPELDPNDGNYDPTKDPYNPNFEPPTDENDPNYCRYSSSCSNYDCTFDPTSSGDCDEDPYVPEADPLNPCYDSRFDSFGPYEPRTDPNHANYDARYDPTATDPIYNPALDPYHCNSEYLPFPHGDPNGDPAGYDPRRDPTHGDYDPTLDPNSDDFNPPWLNPTNTSHDDYDQRYDNTTDYYECYLDPSCDDYDPRLDPSNPGYEERMDPRRSDYYDPKHDPDHEHYDPRFDPNHANYTDDNDPYNPGSNYHPFPHGNPTGEPADGYDSRMDPGHQDYDETLDPNSDNFSPPGSGEQGYDPRYDSEDPYYRPEFDPSHEDYDPRLDPSNPNYRPRMDPRHNLYDPRYDPYHVLYDARLDPSSPFYDHRLDPTSYGYDADVFNTTAPGYNALNDPTRSDYDPRSDDQHPHYNERRDPTHNNYNPEMDPYHDDFNPPLNPSNTSHPNYDPRFDPNADENTFRPLNHATPSYDPRFDTNAPGYDARMDPRTDEYVPKIDPMHPDYDPNFDPDTMGDNGQVGDPEPPEEPVDPDDPGLTFGAINATQDFSQLVTACKCDADVPFTCDEDALGPNGALSVCVKSLSPFVLISALSNMRIQQGSDVNLAVITEDQVAIPDITTREYVSSENGVAVTTRVPPNIFTFAQGRSIAVSGDIILRLAGSERRKLKVSLEAVGVKNAEEGSGRNLQTTGGNAGFEIIVDLEEDADMVRVATVNAAGGRTNGGFIILGTMIFSYAVAMM